MKKIISVFQRNYDGDRLIRNEVTPGAEWVLAGEGVATQKMDGSCCMIRNGAFFKRYEVKQGKTPPLNFEAAGDVDAETGKQQGWVPVLNGPDDRWHNEARGNSPDILPDGTYELIGPKVQGNPEGCMIHQLIAHSSPHLILAEQPPRYFEGIREYLRPGNIEGIVFHHPDGRMAKVKTKDFGMKRTPKQ